MQSSLAKEEILEKNSQIYDDSKAKSMRNQGSNVRGISGQNLRGIRDQIYEESVAKCTSNQRPNL